MLDKKWQERVESMELLKRFHLLYLDLGLEMTGTYAYHALAAALDFYLAAPGSLATAEVRRRMNQWIEE